MTAFTREQLRAFAPTAKAEIIDALIAGADQIAAARINTPLRLAHFLAQIAVETGGLRLLEENLSYSAERLMQVWPNRFPTLAVAKLYARNPEKLANFVYGGRKDLGNTKPGDGWRFRGSSLIMTTGRHNFTLAGFADNPDALRQPGPALTAALKFWTDNNLNIIADRDDLTGLRRKVNGGTHGLPDARNYLAKAKRIFTGAAVNLPADLPAGKVKALQIQLRALGYTEVGTVDGRMGTKTVSAISAFQAENGLEVNGRFDEETQVHLYEAQHRTVIRAEAKPSDSRILKSAGAMKTGALGLISAAGAKAAADPLSQIEAIKEQYDRVRTIAEPFIAANEWLSQHWFLAVGAIGVAVLLYANRIQKDRIEDHLTGAAS